MSLIIPFPGTTKADEPPEGTLEKAKSWGMTHCVIIGVRDNGELAFGGSTSDMGHIILMLEAAKKQIIAELFA